MALRLTVEVAGGTSLREAAQEAVDLAALLDVGVDFDFNGVHLFAHSHSTADEIMKLYECRTPSKGAKNAKDAVDL